VAGADDTLHALKIGQGAGRSRLLPAVYASGFCRNGALAAKLREEFEERYRVRLLENYGLSETLFISAVTPRASHAREGVGKVLPVCSVSIVDPGGNESALNAEGEITVTTPSLMLGYLDEETGDLRSVDREKRFYTAISDILIPRASFLSPQKEGPYYQGRHQHKPSSDRECPYGS